MILIVLLIFSVFINLYVMFHYRKSLASLNSEKEKCKKIMHDMRTPASSIQSGIDGIKIYFPRLVEIYSLADKSGLIHNKISPVQFMALSDSLEYINLASDKLKACIDQLSGCLKEM